MYLDIVYTFITKAMNVEKPNSHIIWSGGSTKHQDGERLKAINHQCEVRKLTNFGSENIYWELVSPEISVYRLQFLAYQPLSIRNIILVSLLVIPMKATTRC
jgi:hypothetical protein